MIIWSARFVLLFWTTVSFGGMQVDAALIERDCRAIASRTPVGPKMEKILVPSEISGLLKLAGVFRGSVDESFVYLVIGERGEWETGYLCLVDPSAVNRKEAEERGYTPVTGTLFRFNRTRIHRVTIEDE